MDVLLKEMDVYIRCEGDGKPNIDSGCGISCVCVVYAVRNKEMAANNPPRHQPTIATSSTSSLLWFEKVLDGLLRLRSLTALEPSVRPTFRLVVVWHVLVTATEHHHPRCEHRDV